MQPGPRRGERPPGASAKRATPDSTRGVAIELFLDRGNPLHWLAVAVLLVSGLLTGWIGVRDGLVRRSMDTSSGVLTGEAAIAAGLVYLLFGLAGVGGAAWFVLKGG
jgi:uncharacterized membrane protein